MHCSQLCSAHTHTHTPSWPSCTCTCIVYYVYRLDFCTVANGNVDITTVHPQIRDYHKIFRETNQHAPVMLVGVKGTSRLNEYKQFCLDVHVPAEYLFKADTFCGGYYTGEGLFCTHQLFIWHVATKICIHCNFRIHYLSLNLCFTLMDTTHTPTPPPQMRTSTRFGGR